MSMYKKIRRKIRMELARFILYVIRKFTEDDFKQTVRKEIIDILSKDNFCEQGTLEKFIQRAYVEAIVSNDNNLWEEVKILDKFLTETAK